MRTRLKSWANRDSMNPRVVESSERPGAFNTLLTFCGTADGAAPLEARWTMPCCLSFLSHSAHFPPDPGVSPQAHARCRSAERAGVIEGLDGVRDDVAAVLTVVRSLIASHSPKSRSPLVSRWFQTGRRRVLGNGLRRSVVSD